MTPWAADLDARRPVVIEAARRADAVVFAAQPSPDQESVTARELTRAPAGTGKTLIFLSGSGVLMQRTGGAWNPDVFTEQAPFTTEPLAEYRKAAEDTVLAASRVHVHSMVIRPGLTWGPGDHGHVSMIHQSVATTGAACHVGEGLNTYSHVRLEDVTRLFSRAPAKGTPGGDSAGSPSTPTCSR